MLQITADIQQLFKQIPPKYCELCISIPLKLYIFYNFSCSECNVTERRLSG